MTKHTPALNKLTSTEHSIVSTSPTSTPFQKIADITRTSKKLLLAAILATTTTCNPSSTTPKGDEADERITTIMGNQDAPRPAPTNPLVFDWPNQYLNSLSARMKQQIIIVEYEGGGVKVLPNCAHEGSYTYESTDISEKSAYIKNSTELYGQLPSWTTTVGLDLSADFEQGMQLNISYVMIGQKNATIRSVERVSLSGDCEGATHYVTEATIGAYSIELDSKTKAGAKLNIQGAKAGGKHGSEEGFKKKGGVIEICKKRDYSLSEPPNDCGIPISFRLLPISDTPTTKETEFKEEIAENPCQPGKRLDDGVCVNDEKPEIICDNLEAGNFDSCQQKCNDGDDKSCTILAQLYTQENEPIQPDYHRAFELYKTACTHNYAPACYKLGEIHQRGISGLVMPNELDAVIRYSQACNNGFALACNNLGEIYAQKNTVSSDATAFKRFKRACNGGSEKGCTNLGKAHQEGKGTTIDYNKATDAYKKACEGGDQEGCVRQGMMYEEGAGDLERDLNTALNLYEDACSADDARGCAEAARMYNAGKGTDRDKKRAKELLEKAVKLQPLSRTAYYKVERLINLWESLFPPKQKKTLLSDAGTDTGEQDTETKQDAAPQDAAPKTD